jgi:hypothetical protein
MKILKIVSVLLLLLLVVFFLVIGEEERTDDIYLIPEGYQGDILVFYNVKDAPEVKQEDGFEVHVINTEGYFVTSTPDMDYGTVTDKYYYVDEKGNRTPISKECVSLFGTGGYSTSENEEVDLIYTGFKLTKVQCGEEFMTSNFGFSDSFEAIKHSVLKRFYGIDEF